jgi:4-alpha-glucanotransferase
MAEPLRLVLDVHCHQPIGNFGWVIEKATAGSYRPLLEALDAHPAIPYVLHVSGPLLEWWLQEAKDLVALVRNGVQRGQIELQASGLYEPILPAIPRRDRVDQVRLHRAWLHELFGADVTTLWLTERVWEPQLPHDLALAGIANVLVDDTHFEGAGLRADELNGWYATEDEGRVVRLFPISKQLRYLVPFRPVDEIRAFLAKEHELGRALLVFGDDGEKFGLWPGTSEWVYGAGWLEKFLSMLESGGSWLKPTTVAEAARALPPAGSVYLPTASYFELEHWALPPAAQKQLDAVVKELESKKLTAAKPFVHGATWRNFLARYPEASRLEQRMVRTSELTRRMGLRPPEGLTQPSQLHPAVRALFRGQCNCAYWHGVFGGLYLPFLRDAVVDELLESRARLEALRGDQEGAPMAELADLDADGEEELLLEGRGWSLWIALARGGMVEVLDHWPTRRNLLNVIGRREEAYHQGLREAPKRKAGDAAPKSIHDLAVALDGDVDELLRYDARPRGGFVLEVAPAGAQAGALAELRGVEPFGVSTARYRLARPLVADRARCDLVAGVDSGGGTNLDLTRSYEIGEECALEAGFGFDAAERAPEPFTAAVRFDLSVPGSGLDERFFLLDDGARVAAGVARDFAAERITLADERGRFRITSSRPFRGALRPIRTVSRSEGGIDTCLQGTTLVLAFDASPRPREPWRLLLRLERV